MEHMINHESDSKSIIEPTLKQYDSVILSFETRLDSIKLLFFEKFHRGIYQK